MRKTHDKGEKKRKIRKRKNQNNHPWSSEARNLNGTPSIADVYFTDVINACWESEELLFTDAVFTVIEL